MLTEFHRPNYNAAISVNDLTLLVLYLNIRYLEVVNFVTFITIEDAIFVFTLMFNMYYQISV